MCTDYGGGGGAWRLKEEGEKFPQFSSLSLIKIYLHTRKTKLNSIHRHHHHHHKNLFNNARGKTEEREKLSTKYIYTHNFKEEKLFVCLSVVR